MVRKFRWTFILLLASLALNTAVLARPAANVGLVQFSGTVVDTGVELSWQTATELDTAGFRLYRLDVNDQPVLLEQIGLITAQGNPTSGATYAVVDQTAVLTHPSATYQLMELGLDGSEQLLESVTVALELAPTAVPLSTLRPPDASTPAAIPPSTATVQPTPTAITPTATAWPTATLPPTETAVVSTNPPAEIAQAVSQPINESADAPETAVEPAAPVQQATIPPDSYPPPPTNTPFPEAYVPPPTVEPIATVPQPAYPVDDDVEPRVNGNNPGETPDEFTIIGTDAIIPETAAPASEAVNETAVMLTPLQSGALIWVTFVLGIVVFLGAVVLALRLFTRRPGS